MLKATIQKNNEIDISYPELKSFLRVTSSGYLPQKYNVFQPDEIRQFLSEADDNEFLVVKVICTQYDFLCDFLHCFFPSFVGHCDIRDTRSNHSRCISKG